MFCKLNKRYHNCVSFFNKKLSKSNDRFFSQFDILVKEKRSRFGLNIYFIINR